MNGANGNHIHGLGIGKPETLIIRWDPAAHSSMRLRRTLGGLELCKRMWTMASPDGTGGKLTKVPEGGDYRLD